MYSHVTVVFSKLVSLHIVRFVLDWMLFLYLLTSGLCYFILMYSYMTLLTLCYFILLIYGFGIYGSGIERSLFSVSMYVSLIS